VVDEQQVRQQLVLDRISTCDEPRERLAVEVDERLHGLDAARVEPFEQRLDATDQRPNLRVLHHVLPFTPSIGECTRFSVFPLPRYMCTPHGRHGSKLRTVRMMSIPRKFSWSFSSKIFCPCTASSYGPGVP